VEHELAVLVLRMSINSSAAGVAQIRAAIDESFLKAEQNA